MPLQKRNKLHISRKHILCETFSCEKFNNVNLHMYIRFMNIKEQNPKNLVYDYDNLLQLDHINNLQDECFSTFVSYISSSI